MKRNTRLALGVFALTMALDAVTKVLAERQLVGGAITLVEDWAWLRLAYNRGVAFSIMEGVPHWILGIGAIVLLAVVVWNLRELAQRAWGAVALALVAAGGLGNALDRLHDGKVTDMISVWRWPVFNVADSAITVGVVLLFLASRSLKSGAKEAEVRDAGAPVHGALRQQDEPPA